MSAFIRVDHLSLDVPIFLQREREAKGWGAMFFGAAFDPPKRRMVRLLDDLNFEVNEGDRLAILGRNGAGKSTLLRVLNKVYQPTSGSLQVEGSCQALLNMSLGFNGEATVRENIFLRGIAMGLKSSFLRHQIDPILEFSGLRDKAAHRLRTLSTGQKMRLGFAISTSVQHDVILMDEWVGAGDSEFMDRAKERMQSRVGGSKIVVLASHSVGLLRDICNKGIVLEGGKLLHAGDITSSLKCYHDLLAEMRAEKTMPMEDATGGASVYGYVEKITSDGEAFQLRGWFVNNEGAVPGGVVMEVNGRRYLADRFQHEKRPDVMRHLGLSHDQCGFRATVLVPGARDIHDLGDDLQVFGGDTLEHADTPLKLAGQVKALLAPTKQAPDESTT
ncbi:MAG: ATP-binding cassette domain-containing protein [Pseudomonadota bacterium]|nr:ATP-binding cassette domain-containing protein [Pseudomonadota bacterium]